MRDSIMRLLKKALTLSALTALFAGAAWAAVPVDGGIGLQEPATPVMGGTGQVPQWIPDVDDYRYHFIRFGDDDLYHDPL